MLRGDGIAEEIIYENFSMKISEKNEYNPVIGFKIYSEISCLAKISLAIFITGLCNQKYHGIKQEKCW